MNKRLKNKGFTLIELLVVIAIIAILSAIVLVAINSARSKGKDSGAISQMNQARNQAEIYYTKEGNYLGLCNPDNPDGAYPLIESAMKTIGFEENTEDFILCEEISGIKVDSPYGNARCRVSSDILEPLWAAHVPLLKKSKSGLPQYYCVDSTGAGMVTTLDFASYQGSLEKKYLGCVPSLE